MAKVGTGVNAAKGLGKVAVAGRAALTEGMSGVAADMIASTNGEVNLANPSGDASPHRRGTFLTTFAVDKHANPRDVETNTALAGPSF